MQECLLQPHPVTEAEKTLQFDHPEIFTVLYFYTGNRCKNWAGYKAGLAKEEGSISDDLYWYNERNKYFFLKNAFLKAEVINETSH